MKVELCEYCRQPVIRSLSANRLPIFLNPEPLVGFDLTDDDPPKALLAEMWVAHETTCAENEWR